MHTLPLSIISWNVNGFRSVLKKGFLEFLNTHQPDLLCLQETRIDTASIPKDLELPYPYVYWHNGDKKGYSGTAIFSKIKPLSVSSDFPGSPPPAEGRVQTAEFESFYIVNVYTPNAQRGLTRLDHRTQTWDPAFRNYLLTLEQTKPVITCGDFNVAHTEIDLANPKTNHKNAGFTDEERSTFSTLLNSGFSDTFREAHPGEANHYSWWTMRTNARERNIGWRLDYVLASKNLFPQVKKAFILRTVLGSDHAPVGIDLNL